MTYTLGIVINAQKIQLIKGVRTFYSLPLKAAKLMAEGLMEGHIGVHIILVEGADIHEMVRFLHAFSTSDGIINYPLSIY